MFVSTYISVVCGTSRSMTLGFNYDAAGKIQTRNEITSDQAKSFSYTYKYNDPYGRLSEFDFPAARRRLMSNLTPFAKAGQLHTRQYISSDGRQHTETVGN